MFCSAIVCRDQTLIRLASACPDSGTPNLKNHTSSQKLSLSDSYFCVKSLSCRVTMQGRCLRAVPVSLLQYPPLRLAFNSFVECGSSIMALSPSSSCSSSSSSSSWCTPEKRLGHFTSPQQQVLVGKVCWIAS